MFSKSRVPRFADGKQDSQDAVPKQETRNSRKSKTLPFVLSTSMIPIPKNAKKTFSGTIERRVPAHKKSRGSEDGTMCQRYEGQKRTDVMFNQNIYSSSTSGEVNSLSRESTDHTTHREKSAPAGLGKPKTQPEIKKVKPPGKTAANEEHVKLSSDCPGEEVFKHSSHEIPKPTRSTAHALIHEPPTVKVVKLPPKLLAALEADHTEIQNNLENTLFSLPKKFITLTKNIFKIRYDFFSGRPNSSDARQQWFDDENKNIKLAIEEAKSEVKVLVEGMIRDVKRVFANRELARQELKSFLEAEKKDNPNAVEELTDNPDETEDVPELQRKLKEAIEMLRIEQAKSAEIAEERIGLQEYKDRVSELESKLTDVNWQLKVAKKDMSQAKLPNKLKDFKPKQELLKFLENRIIELTNENQNLKKNMESKIYNLETELQEKTHSLQTEAQAAKHLRSTLEESEKTIEKVRSEKKVLANLVEKSKTFLLPPQAYQASAREKELWTELEATKVVAKEYQEKTEKLKEEKNKLLSEFQNMSESLSKGPTERLAAEIVRKDDVIKSLKEEVSKLQRKCEEHSLKYNGLKNHLKDLKDKFQSGKSEQGHVYTQVADLKMQVTYLENHVNELMNHNEHLESILAQRSLELEQRDQLFRQQCNMLCVRDNLLNLLKKKDPSFKLNNSHTSLGEKWEKGNEKISRTLESEAHNLDELYKILHEKQNQINKLHNLLQHMDGQIQESKSRRSAGNVKEAKQRKYDSHPVTPPKDSFYQNPKSRNSSELLDEFIDQYAN